jgi:hypothetical protein
MEDRGKWWYKKMEEVKYEGRERWWEEEESKPILEKVYPEWDNPEEDFEDLFVDSEHPTTKV